MAKREITPAQVKAVSKYEAANYDKVLLRLPKGQRDRIKAIAEARGESLNGYIVRLLDEDVGGLAK